MHIYFKYLNILFFQKRIDIGNGLQELVMGAIVKIEELIEGGIDTGIDEMTPPFSTESFFEAFSTSAEFTAVLTEQAVALGVEIVQTLEFELLVFATVTIQGILAPVPLPILAKTTSLLLGNFGVFISPFGTASGPGVIFGVDISGFELAVSY